MKEKISPTTKDAPLFKAGWRGWGLSDEKALNSRKLGRFHDGKVGAKYRGDKNV